PLPAGRSGSGSVSTGFFSQENLRPVKGMAQTRWLKAPGRCDRLLTKPPQETNWPRVGTVALGVFKPAAAQPAAVSPARISPVPLMVTSSITMTKQFEPLLDLSIAPLMVTLECGR